MSFTFDKNLPSIDDRKKLSSAKTATKKKAMKKSKKVVRKKSRAKPAAKKAPVKGFFAKLKKLAGF
jgi:hypothetical protein